MRHILGHQRLSRDRGVRRATAHGKIVADHDHRPAVDLAAAGHAIGRRALPKFPGFIISGDTGNRAELVKSLLTDPFADALVNGEPALVALPLDLVNASH